MARKHDQPSFGAGIKRDHKLTSLGTDTANLGSAAVAHLLGQCSQVNTALKRHLLVAKGRVSSALAVKGRGKTTNLARVDAENGNTGLGSVEGGWRSADRARDKKGRAKAHPGGGNSIFLSIRPGRRRAESRMSIRLVAMMTCSSWKAISMGSFRPSGRASSP